MNFRDELKEGLNESIVFNGKNADEIKSLLKKQGAKVTQEPNGKLSVEIKGKDVTIFKDDEVTVKGKTVTVKKASYAG